MSVNVTFSCNVLSLDFKFSQIVIYRAKSPRSGLEWGDLLNSLICESIAVQFLTFVLHGEQPLVEKDSPSSRTTKTSFFSESPNFRNVSPFLVGATNTFSELIYPLVELPNCVLKQQPHILQFIPSARLFRLSFSGAGTGFVVVLPLPLIFDPPLYILHFTEKQHYKLL